VTKKSEVSIPHSERSWVRASVAREMLGDIAPSTLYDRLNKRLLETKKVGGTRLISVASINKLLDGAA
jgi:hypothetical protein